MGKFRKISKANLKKFHKLVPQMIEGTGWFEEAINGITISPRREWNTMTTMGQYKITLYLEDDTTVYTIYSRIEDAKAGGEVFGEKNNYSGKYNIHQTDMEGALSMLKYYLNKMEPFVDMAAVRKRKIDSVLC